MVLLNPRFTHLQRWSPWSPHHRFCQLEHRPQRKDRQIFKTLELRPALHIPQNLQPILPHHRLPSHRSRHRRQQFLLLLRIIRYRQIPTLPTTSRRLISHKTHPIRLLQSCRQKSQLLKRPGLATQLWIGCHSERRHCGIDREGYQVDPVYQLKCVKVPVEVLPHKCADRCHLCRYSNVTSADVIQNSNAGTNIPRPCLVPQIHATTNQTVNTKNHPRHCLRRCE